MVIFLFHMSFELPTKEESLLSCAAIVIQHLLPSELCCQVSLCITVLKGLWPWIHFSLLMTTTLYRTSGQGFKRLWEWCFDYQGHDLNFLLSRLLYPLETISVQFSSWTLWSLAMPKLQYCGTNAIYLCKYIVQNTSLYMTTQSLGLKLPHKSYPELPFIATSRGSWQEKKCVCRR